MVPRRAILSHVEDSYLGLPIVHHHVDPSQSDSFDVPHHEFDNSITCPSSNFTHYPIRPTESQMSHQEMFMSDPIIQELYRYFQEA